MTEAWLRVTCLPEPPRTLDPAHWVPSYEALERRIKGPGPQVGSGCSLPLLCPRPALGHPSYYWLAIMRWLRKLKDFLLSTILRNCCLSFLSSASASCSLAFSESSGELKESFLLCFFPWARWRERRPM